MKHRFIDFNQKAGNEFSALFDHLKHCFIEFNKVAFWDIQKADYEFSGPFDHLKHRLLDLVHLHFWMPRRQKMSSHVLLNI
jgi:hypothetical protein